MVHVPYPWGVYVAPEPWVAGAFFGFSSETGAGVDKETAPPIVDFRVKVQACLRQYGRRLARAHPP